MMEFYLSKVWVFLVGIVLLGVLLQGLQMQAQAERSSSLEEVAESIQDLFASMRRIGDGLERTIDLKDVLPSSATLTIENNYMVLVDGQDRLLLETPAILVLKQNETGQMQELSSIVLHPGDSIRLVACQGGLFLFPIGPRTSAPGI